MASLCPIFFALSSGVELYLFTTVRLASCCSKQLKHLGLPASPARCRAVLRYSEEWYKYLHTKTDFLLFLHKSQSRYSWPCFTNVYYPLALVGLAPYFPVQWTFPWEPLSRSAHDNFIKVDRKLKWRILFKYKYWKLNINFIVNFIHINHIMTNIFYILFFIRNTAKN